MKSSLAVFPTLAEWERSLRPTGRVDGPLTAALVCLSEQRASAALARLGPAAEKSLAATLDVLGDLKADPETLAACLLNGLIEAGILDTASVAARFSASVMALIDGQHAAEKVWSLHNAHPGASGAEGLRRLLLAIIKDLRVVFILLARQLVAMRSASTATPEHQRALAQLSADIHAPLANRLGIWQLKWELEDLAFRYLQPDTYRRVAEALDEKRDDRERYIANTIATLRAALNDAGIEADLAGRPKHIYSIWRKMQKKGVAISGLYDIRAVRVLVKDVANCYAALGVVHTLWPHVAGEFDDYITRPKGNQYQSLHTAVIGPEGKTLEVQIRSHDMHEHAELGFAAHWRYKEGGGGDQSFERKIAWMRQLIEGKEDGDDDAALLAGFRTEILEDRVYLLTPQGQVMDLPRGATVLDFAYLVHTEVGHRCRGAKVNGRIVPLNFQPASGDRIEILTAKIAAPRRDWLSPHHGFLASGRAREKVRAWFKRADHEQNLQAGRVLLEKELKRMALPHIDLTPLLPRFHVPSLDELHVALALGDVTVSQIARVLHETQAPPAPLPVVETRRNQARPKDAIVIEGVGNLLTTLARCCQPVPGDAIVGFVTRGRGVSIHRAGCASMLRLAARDSRRVIEVAWGDRQKASYEVNLQVRAYDRKGLLKDVTGTISGANVHVLAVNTRLNPDHGTAQMDFALRVADFGQLSTLINRISVLPNVIEARRVT